MRKHEILGSLILVALLVVGCGGSGSHPTPTPIPTPTPTPTASTRSVGFHVGPKGGESSFAVNRTTQSAALPGMFKYLAAFVQTPRNEATSATGTITMSFSGFCATMPSQLGTTNAVGQEVKVYGLGTLSGSGQCGTTITQYGQPSASEGSPIVGDGTLSTLYIYSEIAGDSTASLVAKVYVNGVYTGITCDIGTGKKCADNVTTFSVHDGDMVAVTLTSDQFIADSDNPNIRVMLGKS